VEQRFLAILLQAMPLRRADARQELIDTERLRFPAGTRLSVAGKSSL
jgi:hypothetical protein